MTYYKLTVFTAWLTANPWRVRIAIFALLLVLAVVASLTTYGVAFAGPGSSGSN